MTAQLDAETSVQEPIEDWPLRVWILAGLLAFAGLLIYFVALLYGYNQVEPLRAAAAAFIFFGSIGAAFTLGPKRFVPPVAFACIVGLIMASHTYHWYSSDNWSGGEVFAFCASAFGVGVALPLFQANFHRTWLATDYRLTHFHVWTDAITAAGALAFTGLSWLMLLLLNGLLSLVGISIIDYLWNHGWFGWVWSGGAFGAALGVLRNNLKIIGSLQNVVMIVFSLLAVPMALALVVFLLALLASGGQALWSATDAATPILLICAIGCFILANAIIRDDDAARSKNIVMRITALVLAVGIFPLAVFAAISMGIRIDQHGLSPDRIWAMITICVACLYGAAYWVGLARGRLANWTHFLRQTNLHLAALTCVVALFLALPIMNFGAISTNNQLARLESGAVTPEDFDFSALRWDFGQAGRDALDNLAEGEGDVAVRAGVARDADYPRLPPSLIRRDAAEIEFGVQSDDPAFEILVAAFFERERWRCRSYCMVIDQGVNGDGQRQGLLVERNRAEAVVVEECTGQGPECAPSDIASAVEGPVIHPELTAESTVEIRTMERRFVVIDGVPLSRPLAD